MIRVSASYLMNSFQRIDQLSTIVVEDTAVGVIFLKLLEAELSLGELHSNNSIYLQHTKLSYHSANRLWVAIREITTDPKFEEIIAAYKISNIKMYYEQYKNVLLAEMDAMSLYLAIPKDPFNVDSLLSVGEKLFPERLARVVPEAIFVAREAARCLAFELSTACGFHLFRVVESVLRKYYTHVTGSGAHPKVRNISVYIYAMTKSGCGDVKILSALKQLSDLHRNPLMHPEINLSVEDSITLVGISRSVVSLMIDALPDTIPMVTNEPAESHSSQSPTSQGVMATPQM